MDRVKTQTEIEIIQQMAEAVRTACIEAALAGYEDAAASGLCHEGAWEAAISALQQLDITAIVQASFGDQNSNR